MAHCLKVRQPHLILVTGLPGTGKSTLARALASRYRIPILRKDAVKEPLLDALGASDRAGSRRLSNASFAVMFALARECLQAGADLILEGNFRPGEHAAEVQGLILDSAGASSPAVLVAQVLCRATEPVRIARLKARATDPSRHPGHQDAASANEPPQPTDDFLALPGERFVFDSDARSAAEVDSARLHSLLGALDGWHYAARSPSRPPSPAPQ